MRHRLLPALPLAALLMGAALQPARGQMLQMGVMGGMSVSSTSGDVGDGNKNLTGYIAGAFLRVGVAGFGFQPGVYYTTKGYKSPDYNGTTGTKQKLNYIQIPLIIRLGIPLGGSTRFYVGAGPAIGIRIGCDLTTNGVATDCEGGNINTDF